MVIRAAFRIHKCGSQKIKQPILVYNHCSQKWKHQITTHTNCQFLTGYFIKTTGSLRFWNNWDQQFFGSDFFFKGGGTIKKRHYKGL
jgi:hypothetical protein